MNTAVFSFGRQFLGSSFPFHLVRILLALILVTAAVFKTFDPLPHEASWFMLTVVLAELFLATWLLSGFLAYYAWNAAGLCFGTFACVAAVKVISGETECGCFGAAPVSPWLALAIDLFALTSLAFCRARVKPLQRQTSTRRKFAWAIAFGLLAVIAIARFSAATSAGTDLAEGLTQFGEYVVVEPDAWIGRHCPLIEHVDIGNELASDRWLVLLYHHDCPRCQDVMTHLEFDGSSRVALVSVPPHGVSDNPIDSASGLALGRLHDDIRWFVETPTLLVLDGGFVESVHDSRRVEQFGTL